MVSFTEGFRGGFGLISDAQDKAEKSRQGDLDRETQTQRYNLDREATADYRQGQLNNTAEQNRINSVTAEANLLREKNNETRFSQDGTRIEAEAGLKKAKTATLTDAQAEREKRRSQKESNTAAALQVQSFVDLVEQVKNGEVPYDVATKDRLLEMAKATEGTMMDLNFNTQPNVLYQSERLGGLFEKIGDGTATTIDEPALLDTLNVVLHSNNMVGAGSLVTKGTHPHSGSFADKGFIVVGKRASKVMLQDRSLAIKVDVTIEDPETGKQFTYEAPMTIGRDAAGDDVSMSFKEATDLAAGFFSYSGSMAPYRGILDDIYGKNYDLTAGRKDGDFAQLVVDEVNEAKVDGRRNPELSSPIQGMTMQEFVSNPTLMTAHYTAARSGNFQTPPAISNGDRIYSELSGQKIITNLAEFNENKPPSRAQVLEATQFVSKDKNGNWSIDNSEEWNKWKNATFRGVGVGAGNGAGARAIDGSMGGFGMSTYRKPNQ